MTTWYAEVEAKIGDMIDVIDAAQMPAKRQGVIVSSGTQLAPDSLDRDFTRKPSTCISVCDKV